MMASAMFIAGPAAATQTMSRRGLRKAANFTGTGLAYPKTNGDRASRRSPPNRIDVLEGVEADPPQSGCCVIAEKPRDERVRCLVQGDGK
jgi:hypothetical protein